MIRDLLKKKYAGMNKEFRFRGESPEDSCATRRRPRCNPDGYEAPGLIGLCIGDAQFTRHRYIFSISFLCFSKSLARLGLNEVVRSLFSTVHSSSLRMNCLIRSNPWRVSLR